MKISKKTLYTAMLLGTLTLHTDAAESDKKIIKIEKATTISQPNVQKTEIYNTLKLIDDAQLKIKNFQAKIRITRTESFTESKTSRKADFLYVPGKRPQFACNFTSQIIDGRKIDLSEQYIFDGDYLIEKHTKERLFKKRRVTPYLPKDKAHLYENPLAAGDGPFPVPFGQSAKHMMRLFDVTIIKSSAKNDPRKNKNFIHIQLKPKKHHRISYTQLDFWYNKKTKVPIKAHAVDDNDNATIVEFGKSTIDQPFDAKRLSTALPKDQTDWFIDVQTNPRGKATPKPAAKK